jgi:hypothetical protein
MLTYDAGMPEVIIIDKTDQALFFLMFCVPHSSSFETRMPRYASATRVPSCGDQNGIKTPYNPTLYPIFMSL